MGSIGLAYFIIVILSWVYKTQDNKAFQELTLLIVNRLLLIVSIFYSLGVILELYAISRTLMVAPIPNYYINTCYLAGGVTTFLLLLSLFLIVPYFAKNIWYSSGMAIVVLHLVITLFYPRFSIENIVYKLFIGEGVNYSWTFISSNYLTFFIENLTFFLIWLFFFHRLKKKIKPTNNIHLENHLIQK